MKIVFISDIHGSLPRAEKVFAYADTIGADTVVLLGDAMYHGPRNPIPDGYNPKDLAAFLNERKGRIIAVRGNCDSEVDQMLLEFPILADFAWVLADGHRMFLTHGHLWNKNSLPALRAGDVLVYGHTHIPQASAQGDINIWNPGSCSLPKEGYTASFGVYENGVFSVISLENNDVICTQTL